MPITFVMKGSYYFCSQTTGGVESAGPLHVDIPHTGRRGFDLPSEDSVLQHLKLPYEGLFQFIHSRGYCCKLWPSNNPISKNHKE
jgi:hypothetical protein